MNASLNFKSSTRQTRWRRKNAPKYLAHVAVQRALRSGDLIKGPCAVCGTSEPPIDGHHDDYSRPLDVTWLCRKHHARLHATGLDGDFFAAGDE